MNLIDEINKEIHDFFKKFKDLKSLDLDQLTGLLEKKGLFRVVVLKDSIYARKVLEETKLFNLKKK